MNENEVNRPRRLKVLAAMTATLGLLSGVLLFAEHDASARTVPTAASLLARQAAGVAPQAAPAVAQELLPSTASQADVLGLAQQTAAQSAAAVQALLAVPNPVASVICAALLAQRAATVQSFAILIASFPQFTAALVTQRSAALAVIDAALRQFGCPVPSGTAI